MSPTCSHRWSLVGGCLRCTCPHAVAPYIEAGNHRALEPGRVYQCRCGAALHIPEDAACPHCGEEDCEASCTAALVARQGRRR